MSRKRHFAIEQWSLSKIRSMCNSLMNLRGIRELTEVRETLFHLVDVVIGSNHKMK
jgi:hypothetical protein